MISIPTIKKTKACPKFHNPEEYDFRARAVNHCCCPVSPHSSKFWELGKLMPFLRLQLALTLKGLSAGSGKESF